MLTSLSGGSVATEFATQKDGPFKDAKIYAAVRGKEQTKSASIPGLEVVQLDCGDHEAVKDVVLNNHSERHSRCTTSFD